MPAAAGSHLPAKNRPPGHPHRHGQVYSIGVLKDSNKVYFIPSPSCRVQGPQAAKLTSFVEQRSYQHSFTDHPLSRKVEHLKSYVKKMYKF